MSTRQTAGFVESLLRLIGLNWTVPDFSTLSSRQRTLAVNIPYRGSKGPLHLPVDTEPLRCHWFEPNGEGHQGRGRRRVARAQARRAQTAHSPLGSDQWRTRLAAQDPPRNRQANARVETQSDRALSS